MFSTFSIVNHIITLRILYCKPLFRDSSSRNSRPVRGGSGCHLFLKHARSSLQSPCFPQNLRPVCPLTQVPAVPYCKFNEDTCSCFGAIFASPISPSSATLSHYYEHNIPSRTLAVSLALSIATIHVATVFLYCAHAVNKLIFHSVE